MKIYAENYVTFKPNTEAAKEEFRHIAHNVIDGCKQQQPEALRAMSQLIIQYKASNGLWDKVIGVIANMTDECIVMAHFDHKNPKDEPYDLHYDEEADRHYIIA